MNVPLVVDVECIVCRPPSFGSEKPSGIWGYFQSISCFLRQKAWVVALGLYYLYNAVVVSSPLLQCEAPCSISVDPGVPENVLHPGFLSCTLQHLEGYDALHRCILRHEDIESKQLDNMHCRQRCHGSR